MFSESWKYKLRVTRNALNGVYTSFFYPLKNKCENNFNEKPFRMGGKRHYKYNLIGSMKLFHSILYSW